MHDPRTLPTGDRWLPGLALVCEVYSLLVLGLLGFGIVLFWAPGLLLLPFTGPSGSEIADVLGLTVLGALMGAGILIAMLGVRGRIVRGDGEGARLPALAMVLGNLSLALLGGLLGSDLFVAAGIIGAVLFFPVFLRLNSVSRPNPAGSPP